MQLHIPQGINFECSGCANCCLEWPVPITQADHTKLSALVVRGELPGSEDLLFKPLKAGEDKLRLFSHSLEKRADGRCNFLTHENKCLVHEKFGAQSKPSICRLFPYTFMPAPDGTYVSISFASSAALTNFGRPLVEQYDLLLEQFGLFQRLFPGITEDWSGMQGYDGRALDWSEFLSIERTYLLQVAEPSQRGEGGRVDRLLLKASKALYDYFGSPDLERKAGLHANARLVDQIVVQGLMNTYFPDDLYGQGSCDLDANAMAQALVNPPPKMLLEHGNAKVSFGELYRLQLGNLSDAEEDLLRRFVYCRLFAKLFFGRGFCNLSLLAGLNHLAALIAITRISLKMSRLTASVEDHDGKTTAASPFTELAELVRGLERRLTVANLSAQSVSILEVLMTSPARLESLMALAG